MDEHVEPVMGGAEVAGEGADRIEVLQIGQAVADAELPDAAAMPRRARSARPRSQLRKCAAAPGQRDGGRVTVTVSSRTWRGVRHRAGRRRAGRANAGRVPLRQPAAIRMGLEPQKRACGAQLESGGEQLGSQRGVEGLGCGRGEREADPPGGDDVLACREPGVRQVKAEQRHACLGVAVHDPGQVSVGQVDGEPS